MTRPIFFRSLRSGRDRAGSAIATIRQRGSDWSHLRPYTDTDDIRDIAWSRIRPEGFSVRERENHGDYSIISCWRSSPYDNFWIENESDSRKNATEKTRYMIKMSAKYGQYPYREYSGDTGLTQLIQMKPENAIIFICGYDISDEIKLLAYHNDIIYLDLTHPFESNPNESVLFSGGVLDTKEYKKVFQETQESKKNNLKKIRASYVSIPTTADVDIILNTFFKKRYTHG